MSNILSDIHRQSIARSIIETCGIATYCELGCHEGESMSWYASNFPLLKLAGTDLNIESLDKCVLRFSEGSFYNEASLYYLRYTFKGVPPVLFYLDTDWSLDAPPKREELEAIFGKHKKFVAIVNSVNSTGHPLRVEKPTSVDEVFGFFGRRCRQFIVPTYKYPELENGYVVLNCCEPVEFDDRFFKDVLA